MSLPSRLLGANPSIQVSTLLSGTLTTPSAKQAFVFPTAYESIATVTLNGTQGYAEFLSIPATYTHLQVRFIGRSSQAGTARTSISMLLNSVQAGTPYDNQRLFSHSASNVDFTSAANNNRMDVGHTLQDGNTSNIYSVGIVDIHDYTSTTAFKRLQFFGGWTDATSTITLGSGQWRSTSAVTAVAFSIENNGFNWASGSTFSLYGIKGAA